MQVCYTSSSRSIVFMELVNHRPKRAVVRCMAKMHLLEAADDALWDEPIADELLEELADTLFRSRRYQAMYQECRSKLEARQVGDRLAEELAENYRHVMNRRHDPVVQSFNALLE